MSHIEIYSSTRCPYCDRAKQLLQSKGESYTEFLIDQTDGKLDEMLARSQRRTVPQIFINDQHIGGFDDLYALDQAGKLDLLLAD